MKADDMSAEATGTELGGFTLEQLIYARKLFSVATQSVWTTHEHFGDQPNVPMLMAKQFVERALHDGAMAVENALTKKLGTTLRQGDPVRVYFQGGAATARFYDFDPEKGARVTFPDGHVGYCASLGPVMIGGHDAHG